MEFRTLKNGLGCFWRAYHADSPLKGKYTVFMKPNQKQLSEKSTQTCLAKINVQKKTWSEYIQG